MPEIARLSGSNDAIELDFVEREATPKEMMELVLARAPQWHRQSAGAIGSCGHRRDVLSAMAGLSILPETDWTVGTHRPGDVSRGYS